LIVCRRSLTLPSGQHTTIFGMEECYGRHYVHKLVL